jgi:hypothetical protein
VAYLVSVHMRSAAAAPLSLAPKAKRMQATNLPLIPQPVGLPPTATSLRVVLLKKAVAQPAQLGLRYSAAP